MRLQANSLRATGCASSSAGSGLGHQAGKRHSRDGFPSDPHAGNPGEGMVGARRQHPSASRAPGTHRAWSQEASQLSIAWGQSSPVPPVSPHSPHGKGSRSTQRAVSIRKGCHDSVQCLGSLSQLQRSWAHPAQVPSSPGLCLILNLHGTAGTGTSRDRQLHPSHASWARPGLTRQPGMVG